MGNPNNNDKQPAGQFGGRSTSRPQASARLSLTGGCGVASLSHPAVGDGGGGEPIQNALNTEWYYQQLEQQRMSAARMNFDFKSTPLSFKGKEVPSGVVRESKGSPNWAGMLGEGGDQSTVTKKDPMSLQVVMYNQDVRYMPESLRKSLGRSSFGRPGTPDPKVQVPKPSPPVRDTDPEIDSEMMYQIDRWCVNQLRTQVEDRNLAYYKEVTGVPHEVQASKTGASMDKGFNTTTNESQPLDLDVTKTGGEDTESAALLPIEEMTWAIEEEEFEVHLRLCARHVEHRYRELFPAADSQFTSTRYPVAWVWAGGLPPEREQQCNCSGAQTRPASGPIRALAEVYRRFGIWAQIILIKIGEAAYGVPCPPPEVDEDQDSGPEERQEDRYRMVRAPRITGAGLRSYADDVFNLDSDYVYSCEDKRHCIWAAGCKDTELRNDASALGQNMLLFINENVLRQLGVYAVDPEQGAATFRTVFTSTRTAQARNVSGTFDLTFPGTFAQNEVIEPFRIDWSSPLLVNESTIIGDSTLAAAGMVESRKAADRIAIDLNVAPNVANVLCHDIPVQGARYDNSGFYMVGFAIWFQIQALRDSQGAGDVWNFRLINNDLQAFRNYNDNDPQATLLHIRMDDLSGALIFNADVLTPRDIVAICHISSGFPRLETGGGRERAPQQYFEGGAMPVRFYSRNAIVRPAQLALNGDDFWVTLGRVAELRGERAEYVAGYMRAALICNGATVTSGQPGARQLHWMTSTMEIGRYVCPRPHDTLILWRWLGLMSQLPNPMDMYISSQEYTVIKTAYAGARRQLGSAVAALYTTMAAHVLNQFNLWGRELNDWMSQRPTEATSILNGLLKPPNGASTYTLQAIVLTQIKEWTGATACIYAIATPEFGTTTQLDDIADAGYYYSSLGVGVPRLGDLPAMAFLMQELPREWGIFSQKVSWNLRAEIMTGQTLNRRMHGIYLRYGDKRYHPGSSSDAINKCSQYVSYGILAINCIYQASDARQHPEIAFEYVPRGLETTLGPHAPQAAANRQPIYHEELQVIVPGTLRTYHWGDACIWAPVLLQGNLAAITWDYVTNHPEQDPLLNVGYMWRARPTTLPGFDPEVALDGILGGTSSRTYNIREQATAPPTIKALTQVHAPPAPVEPEAAAAGENAAAANLEN